MKTTYLKPEIGELYMSLEEMIAASDPILPGGNNNNLNDAPTTGETSGNLSRYNEIWDDEEEEIF